MQREAVIAPDSRSRRDPQGGSVGIFVARDRELLAPWSVRGSSIRFNDFVCAPVLRRALLRPYFLVVIRAEIGIFGRSGPGVMCDCFGYPKTPGLSARRAAIAPASHLTFWLIWETDDAERHRQMVQSN
jgi:hypothetical protein